MDKKDFIFLMENLNISNDYLDTIAFQTGFIKRNRSIKTHNFLSTICIESVNGIASSNDIAAHMEGDSNVSRQAVWKKMNSSLELYLKRILALIITNKINNSLGEKVTIDYKRILVQDSTIIRLPVKLFSAFSGVANAQSKVCNARVQCVYEFIAEQFVYFSIDSYSKNDLSVAPLLDVQPGDLVLRDRGYLMADEIQRHLDHKAQCVFRYRFNMILCDPITENVIDLFSDLKKVKSLDRIVMLNNKSKTLVRILAHPVSKEIADRRRRKTKLESKNTPSEKLLESLSWSIYITTIMDRNIGYEYIYKAYSLRWRIEIIFKCWKSNLAFDQIHNVSKIQLNILLLARFITIIIIQIVFKSCRIIVKKVFDKSLSLLKFTKYVLNNSINLTFIIEEINNNKDSNLNNIKYLARFCSYDKRERKNFQQCFDQAFS